MEVFYTKMECPRIRNLKVKATESTNITSLVAVSFLSFPPLYYISREATRGASSGFTTRETETKMYLISFFITVPSSVFSRLQTLTFATKENGFLFFMAIFQ